MVVSNNLIDNFIIPYLLGRCYVEIFGSEQEMESSQVEREEEEEEDPGFNLLLNTNWRETNTTKLVFGKALPKWLTGTFVCIFLKFML